jgi:glycosyltransferase involved in cell wall biosynthesis
VLEVNAPLRAEARRFRKLPYPALAVEIERTVFRSTRRILVVSPALRNWLEVEGVPPERVDIVPNAVAPERFGPRRQRSDGAFVAGFCGSLKAWHGVEVLIEACALAFAEEPSLRLEVVGSGPLESLVREARLPAERLVVHGPLSHSEAIERLRGWNAGLAPYLPLDGFYFSPLKVFEYMAAGLCPVASALGEIPALLGEGERGVLVRAGDASAMATALVELARNRRRASELGSRAQTHVLETYTWERNARAVLEALGVQAGELAA